MLGFSLYILTGIFSGVLAGLFGVGGGIIIVPSLAYIFNYLNMPPNAIMHMAASTSLAAIILTTLTAVIIQHNQRKIVWPAFGNLAPGIVLGTLLGTYIASLLPNQELKAIFAVFILIISCRLFWSATSDEEKDEYTPHYLLAAFWGLIAGMLSGLLGIGGGIIAVPILLRLGLSIHKAAATSSACVLLLSIVGTIGFTVTGWDKAGMPVGSTGYVYWPAALAIAIPSIFFVRVGTRLACRLSGDHLKKIFAVFLALIGIQMLWQVFAKM